jgi:phenylalanyl-tRNA synthetase beta chain
VDLIEEVARTHGLDNVPTTPKLSIAVRPPQTAELARRELASTLTGLGFFEAVTFSFVSPARAGMFTPPGLENIGVDDARRAHEPTLRPSVLPGLLACRKVNQDGAVDQPGGVRLFEVASVFGQSSAGPGQPVQTIERRHLALLLDAPAGPASKFDDRQTALRLMRGAVEAVVRTLAGAAAPPEFKAVAPPFAALDGGGFAGVLLSGKPAGYIGLVSGAGLKEFGLEAPAAAAELNLDALLQLYPPRARVAPLPAFPATEKDLSVILDEGVTWAGVSACVRGARPEFFEHLGFVTVYRGKQAGAGKKSVTLRLRFRAADRTLRAEEADAQARRVAEHLQRELGGEFRTA